mmetsp:Transcript_99842/g.202497  ORF Transcript_99842/g.202497 Transcript_99842/m.202497 type:complete len:86 (+) Transcript_99842:177-434(+)
MNSWMYNNAWTLLHSCTDSLSWKEVIKLSAPRPKCTVAFPQKIPLLHHVIYVIIESCLNHTIQATLQNNVSIACSRTKKVRFMDL